MHDINVLLSIGDAKPYPSFIIKYPSPSPLPTQNLFYCLLNNFLTGKQNGLTIIDGPTPDGNDVLKKLCNSDNFVNRRFVSTSGYLYIQFATGSIPMAFKAVYDFGKPLKSY